MKVLIMRIKNNGYLVATLATMRFRSTKV
jgi:hypothetical protein